MAKTKFVQIQVKWTDSVGPTNYWNHRTDLDLGTSVIDTLGWLVKETNHYVALASSVSTSGCYGGVITIPKVAIITRKDG